MDDLRASRLLSRVLRHDPQSFGLVLHPGGWVSVSELLDALARKPRLITREQLERIVATSDKQRFALDRDVDRIRANQGHSVVIDLGLEPVQPPDQLFHGTAARNVDSILEHGLIPMRRHAVHLSIDRVTARKVGSRHGAPAVLLVDSGRMHVDGFVFTRSANGVWLVDAVPPRYLSTSSHRLASG